MTQFKTYKCDTCNFTIVMPTHLSLKCSHCNNGNLVKITKHKNDTNKHLIINKTHYCKICKIQIDKKFKYCTNCKQTIANNKIKKVNCKNCNTKFKATKKHQTYCSNECKTAFKLKNSKYTKMHTCILCKTTENTNEHHIIMKKHNGKIKVVLCETCHLLIHKWIFFLEFFLKQLQQIEKLPELLTIKFLKSEQTTS